MSYSRCRFAAHSGELRVGLPASWIGCSVIGGGLLPPGGVGTFAGLSGSAVSKSSNCESSQATGPLRRKRVDGVAANSTSAALPDGSAAFSNTVIQPAGGPLVDLLVCRPFRSYLHAATLRSS